MASAAARRLLLLTSAHQQRHQHLLAFCSLPRLNSVSPSLPLLERSPSLFSTPLTAARRRLSSSAPPPPPSIPSKPPRFTNTDVSFEWSDDEDETNSDRQPKSTAAAPTVPVDKSKLPPPYDPFNKKPAIEEPKDPKNLQEIFHKMRTEGLTNHAVKMFDALSKDGLTHEALELFSQIKDKGAMPDVVAHTAVIEAYAFAGSHSKEALKTFDRMLASGVSPNAYTYAVLIQGLSRDGKVKEASRLVLEMMGKGMRPNPRTYVSLFEAFLREKKEEEAMELLDEMRGKGFVPDEKKVREELGRRGQMFRSMMSLLFGK